MPSWNEFAWAAFLYGAIGGDKHYLKIMRNSRLLHSLRNTPQKLSIDDIRELVIKGFLNRWKCRLPNTSSTAKKIRDALQDVEPQLRGIASCTLRDPFSTNVKQHTQSKFTLGEVMEKCYKRLCRSTDKFAATATSKLLHVLHPSLFVMWDKLILGEYRKKNPQIEETGNGYVQFLGQMQQLILTVDRAFAGAHLDPPSANGELPENYLSSRMGYTPPKTAAKYADEYNWVVFTNKVKVPPAWHP